MRETLEGLPIDAARQATLNGRDISRTPDYAQNDFIDSRRQLWREVASGGSIKLFSDALSLARDLKVAAGEMFDLRHDPVYDGVGLPKGDGSPVRILGGFGSSQAHYFDSARSISRARYEVQTLPWGHANLKNPMHMADFMLPELIYSKRATGKRAKLVVHSLGGYDAAAMFALYPQEFVDSVEHVVFVGSPRPRELNKALAFGYVVLHMFEEDNEFQINDRLGELQEIVDSGLIKVTSVGTSYDPAVRGDHLARDENHYVIDGASHSALGMNRHTMRVVAHAFVGEEVDSRAHPYIHHPVASLAA